MKDIQAQVSSGPWRALLYIRNLYIVHDKLIQPRDLDEIFDAFVAFKNVKVLQLVLFATRFVDPDLTLTSRYFAHFQPTLRSLQLGTPTGNPKDLIAFISFFPFLEDVTLFFFEFVGQMADGELGELDPNRLNPLRGTLRTREFGPDSGFIWELAKVRVQYHTLELCLDPASSDVGLQALVAACASTLRVLQLPRHCMPFFTYW
jgi:hypothetical protein